MPETHAYDYAVLRIVPNVERGEFVNAGVVLHCPEKQFLECHVHVDEGRLRALSRAADVDMVRRHLEAFPKICSGDDAGGPIAKLSRRERFHWLVAPRSTIIQVSPVHAGMCESPEAALAEIFRRLVMEF